MTSCRGPERRDRIFSKDANHFSAEIVLIRTGAAVAGFATIGTQNVQINKYEVPTQRSPTHDPALAPDGLPWCAGQAENKIGRLNTNTGGFKKYLLRVQDCGPHGWVDDANGNVWFTAISGAYFGKLDRTTGAIVGSPLPIDGLYLAYSGVNKMAVVDLDR
jgi:streptogramin lyase